MIIKADTEMGLYAYTHRKPRRGEMIIKRIRRWAYTHMGTSAYGHIRIWAKQTP